MVGTTGGDSAANAMTAYEVHSISAAGILSWEESAFTPSIASYEPVFGQDIDGDGYIGVDIGTLEDITLSLIHI